MAIQNDDYSETPEQRTYGNNLLKQLEKIKKREDIIRERKKEKYKKLRSNFKTTKQYKQYVTRKRKWTEQWKLIQQKWLDSNYCLLPNTESDDADEDIEDNAKDTVDQESSGHCHRHVTNLKDLILKEIAKERLKIPTSELQDIDDKIHNLVAPHEEDEDEQKEKCGIAPNISEILSEPGSATTQEEDEDKKLFITKDNVTVILQDNILTDREKRFLTDEKGDPLTKAHLKLLGAKRKCKTGTVTEEEFNNLEIRRIIKVYSGHEHLTVEIENIMDKIIDHVIHDSELNMMFGRYPHEFCLTDNQTGKRKCPNIFCNICNCEKIEAIENIESKKYNRLKHSGCKDSNLRRLMKIRSKKKMDAKLQKAVTQILKKAEKIKSKIINPHLSSPYYIRKPGYDSNIVFFLIFIFQCCQMRTCASGTRMALLSMKHFSSVAMLVEIQPYMTLVHGPGIKRASPLAKTISHLHITCLQKVEAAITPHTFVYQKVFHKSLQVRQKTKGL